MSTCIVGAGLSGLATAIKLKQDFPDEDVLIINHDSSVSNTQLAGQRIRAGISNIRDDSKNEILELLTRRNNDIVTPQMQLFAELAERELTFWHNFPGFIDTEDKQEWFGPQWAGGHGKSVLNWFTKTAMDLGIKFTQGEVRKIFLDNQTVSGLLVHKKNDTYREVEADRYILAGGNISGKMFLSTNKAIPYSPQELVFDAGLSIVDSTIHMFHPFGRSDREGNPRLGCFETDRLEGASVYSAPPNQPEVLDEQTTIDLKTHGVHYVFPEVTDRLRRRGSVVRLEIPTPEGISEEFARVAHHYGHIAIETTDGISVNGTNNLYAVGDASGLGYWTNHQERFPGFALLKCLTDAGYITDTFKNTKSEGKPLRENATSLTDLPRTEDRNTYREIRKINSAYLDLLYTTEDPGEKNLVATSWVRTLSNYDGPVRNSPFFGISLTTAFAHGQIAQGKKEPFQLNRALFTQLLPDRRLEGMIRTPAFAGRKEAF